MPRAGSRTPGTHAPHALLTPASTCNLCSCASLCPLICCEYFSIASCVTPSILFALRKLDEYIGRVSHRLASHGSASTFAWRARLRMIAP